MIARRRLTQRTARVLAAAGLLFVVMVVFLATQMAAGNDPALGSGRPKATAAQPPAVAPAAPAYGYGDQSQAQPQYGDQQYADPNAAAQYAPPPAQSSTS